MLKREIKIKCNNNYSTVNSTKTLTLCAFDRPYRKLYKIKFLILSLTCC